MDPTVLINALGPSGIIVAVLLCGLRWLGTQHSKQVGEIGRLSEDVRRECRERESVLRSQVLRLEGQLTEGLTKHLVQSTSAIVTVSHAMEQLTEAIQELRTPSGSHPIVAKDPK